MAAPGIPQNFNVQSANRQILASWDISPGADSYVLQRSADGVTFTTLVTISGSPLATSYLDTTAVVSTQYWYQVAAVTASVSSPYTNPQSIAAAPTGEMTLAQIRKSSQQTADRVNSNFVTLPEWNSFINLAMAELYDLLITVYEDLYVASPVYFNLSGSVNNWPLPNGGNSFLDGNGNTFTPKPFYKLLGVDLAVNTAQNAWVTLNKFNFIDRNQYLYPNTTSTIYGVYNMRYRLFGLDNIEFIPTPASNQQVRLWYIPRITELLQDTDTSDIGISGWLRYVIVRAAKYALDKEESDTTKLDSELLFLKTRIEESAANRDAGQPDTISNTRSGDWSAGWGPFGGRGGAGW
jgi:hypothetical protein